MPIFWLRSFGQYIPTKKEFTLETRHFRRVTSLLSLCNVCVYRKHCGSHNISKKKKKYTVQTLSTEKNNFCNNLNTMHQSVEGMLEELCTTSGSSQDRAGIEPGQSFGTRTSCRAASDWARRVKDSTWSNSWIVNGLKHSVVKIGKYKISCINFALHNA